MSNSVSRNYEINSVNHGFPVYWAVALGSPDLAILLSHFNYWISVNSNKKKNFHEGKYWTYDTLTDIHDHFPYWSVKQIERLINKLVDCGVLIKGNFNQNKYDRTCWYTIDLDRLNEMVTVISRNREINNPKSGNQESDSGKCSNTHTIPNTTPHEKRLRRKKVVAVVPKKKEDQYTCGVTSEKIYKYLKEFSLNRSKHWIIPQLDIFFSCQMYGCDYVIAQINHMTTIQQQSEKDEQTPSKERKTKPIVKPRSYFQLALKNNYANFLKEEQS